jgi:hypothetical protein
MDANDLRRTLAATFGQRQKDAQFAKQDRKRRIVQGNEVAEDPNDCHSMFIAGINDAVFTWQHVPDDGK